MSTRNLILAMAPISLVVSKAMGNEDSRLCEDVLSSNETLASKNADDCDGGTMDEAETESWADVQENFASLLASCWTDPGPSPRYLKALIKLFVATLERDGAYISSDSLMNLIFRAGLAEDLPPEPEESCYLSFVMKTSAPLHPLNPQKIKNSGVLRIRIFPYHNDVALRLWEAGATLAEYFLEYPSLIEGKRVIELGAGVGLTGLVIAGCCGAEHVYLTDYTQKCLLNMDHNLQINHEWLNRIRGENVDLSTRIEAGYLEWSTFLDNGQEDSETNDCSSKELRQSYASAGHGQSMENFRGAHVLIAADVAYDISQLPCLVAVMQGFLSSEGNFDCNSSSSHTGSKKAIFGITRRNLATFETFMGLLDEAGISCDWIASGSACDALPRVFHCKFNQERSDVRIALLQIKERRQHVQRTLGVMLKLL